MKGIQMINLSKNFGLKEAAKWHSVFGLAFLLLLQCCKRTEAAWA